MHHYNHDNVCKKCSTTSLHLCQITCKVLGIIDSVINALLPTSIFWEMKHNQKHQSRNSIMPLVECLPLALSNRVIPLWKTIGQRWWPQSWTTRTLLVLKNTCQQIEPQAKRMCRDWLHRLVKKHGPFCWRVQIPSIALKIFPRSILPHPRVKVSIVGSLRDREVACSASDRQGSNFESCVWRTVSSQSSHHPQEVLLAQFSLYVHKGGLKPDSFHFHAAFANHNSKSQIIRIMPV